jgi:predicted DNA-binding transcriptional regulator AlpA
MTLKTIPEATRELRISRSSLYRILLRGNRPRVVKVGGESFIPADELSGWLATRPNPFEKGSDAA